MTAVLARQGTSTRTIHNLSKVLGSSAAGQKHLCEPKKLKKVLKIVRWENQNISASHINF